MEESVGDLDGVGGSFDLDGLKKKYRRQDTVSKPRNALAAIEREILQEIASQSGRYGDRLDALLSEMTTLRQTIEPAIAQLQQDRMNDAKACQALNAGITQYNQLRAQAQRVQHYLIIHREAMGFWNHDDVFRCYPIPAALTPLSPTRTPRSPEHP
jgi:t-SNARE complex subunit (syntaxin)